MSKSENILINGPINVVRLEGTVSNIKKVIYVFMDYHEKIEYQTKCPSFSSLDLYQYLAINLKNIAQPVDFMFEITESYLGESSYEYKDIYIREVVELFKSQYSVKNKTIQSPISNLVRYHYIDVRDYIFNTINYYDHMLKEILENLNCTDYIAKTLNDDLKYYLGQIIFELNYWDVLLFGDLKLISQKTTQNLKRLQKDKQIDQKEINNDIKAVPKFIHKIREKYKNPQIKNNLQNIFNFIKNTLIQNKELCFDIINEMDKYKDNVVDFNQLHYSKCSASYNWGQSLCDNIDTVKSIIKKYMLLSHKILNMFSDVMDIFFLRRFLDKDYIKHAIVYTGCAHSINYIQHLITKYNFKVTHVSYSKNNNIDDLNKHLKKFDSTDDRREYQKMFYPPKLIQCSNLSSFPKNFN